MAAKSKSPYYLLSPPGLCSIHHECRSSWLGTPHSYHDAYEPEYDEQEILEEPNEELDAEGYGEGNEGLQNGVNGHQDFITSGDPAAAAAASGKFKDGRDFDKLAVPKDKRTTTPYMTKYEKARLLGTRALQIRYRTEWGRVCVRVQNWADSRLM